MQPVPTTSGERRPAGRVAVGTPERERERLALQQRAYSNAEPLRIQSLIWLLRASNAAANEMTAALRPIDLSLSGFNILQALANTPAQELEPCELAERLLVSRPSVTGLIDTLERKALVARRRHPEDRRRVLVGLTDTARKLLDAHYPDHYAALERLTENLSEDEMETLVLLLQRIRGATPPSLAEDEPDE